MFLLLEHRSSPFRFELSSMTRLARLSDFSSLLAQTTLAPSCKVSSFENELDRNSLRSERKNKESNSVRIKWRKGEREREINETSGTLCSVSERLGSKGSFLVCTRSMCTLYLLADWRRALLSRFVEKRDDADDGDSTLSLPPPPSDTYPLPSRNEFLREEIAFVFCPCLFRLQPYTRSSPCTSCM